MNKVLCVTLSLVRAFIPSLAPRGGEKPKVAELRICPHYNLAYHFLCHLFECFVTRKVTRLNSQELSPQPTGGKEGSRRNESPTTYRRERKRLPLMKKRHGGSRYSSA